MTWTACTHDFSTYPGFYIRRLGVPFFLSPFLFILRSYVRGHLSYCAPPACNTEVSILLHYSRVPDLYSGLLDVVFFSVCVVPYSSHPAHFPSRSLAAAQHLTFTRMEASASACAGIGSQVEQTNQDSGDAGASHRNSGARWYPVKRGSSASLVVHAAESVGA